MSAGFIGLGAMGAPMARHLHARGLLGVVGNRTAAKAQALAAELGVAAATSAADFAACEVVALCVSLDADVLENVQALAAVLLSVWVRGRRRGSAPPTAGSPCL